jgi:transposase
MATERLPMRNIREILRLKWTLDRSHRDTARSLGISPGAVASVISRARAIGLTWEALEGLTEDGLEQRLYGPKVTGRPARPRPDPAWIHTELRRAGVTLELLHLEYLGQHPDGYRYSAFCLHYRHWVDRQRLSMRQVHTAGEKLFVDYSGKTPEVVDPSTGVVRPVELFVAVLGASNYTYVEATDSQRSADFIQSHSHAVEYVGGVPAAIVPDQLRTASASRAVTNRFCSAPTKNGRRITPRRSSPPDRPSLAIKPKRKSASRWRNAGSSRGSGMRPSFRSRR